MRDRGGYYNKKTIAWFQDRDFDCEKTEILRVVPTDFQKVQVLTGPKAGQILERKVPLNLIYQKKDLFGCLDGIASNFCVEIRFNTIHNKARIAEHMKKFALLKTTFTMQNRSMIIDWTPRKKQPDFYDVSAYRECVNCGRKHVSAKMVIKDLEVDGWQFVFPIRSLAAATIGDVLPPAYICPNCKEVVNVRKDGEYFILEKE